MDMWEQRRVVILNTDFLSFVCLVMENVWKDMVLNALLSKCILKFRGIKDFVIVGCVVLEQIEQEVVGI